MTRDQKIQAAKAMTGANIEHHRIHLEEGYVEATVSQVVRESKINYISKPVFSRFDIQIWGINKQGKLQMI